MKYLAHRDQEFEREQSLIDHLEETAELAGQYAEAFGAYLWGYCAGLLHDIGKYSQEFQRRIRGSEEQVDHATAGAQLCHEKKGYYSLLSYCIAGHHAGLADTGTRNDRSNMPTLYGRLKKQIPDYNAYKGEIQIPQLMELPFVIQNRKEAGFASAMFIRMLYSCLVDADFLNTETFMNKGMTERDCGDSISVLYEKCMSGISGWLKNEDRNTINGRRTEILKHYLEMASKERGMFRLTVPTGGGKTMASLAFALKHAAEHGMNRVIYVIPYTSIIEQTAGIFAEKLGQKNVLEHHSNVDYTVSDELKSMQLAAENWDKPVVVTTNVQFFESMFSNRSSKCRKLHNVADSVIVFDEAQMLPTDYLKPCIAVMEQLIRHYRSSVVLCTATQPALQNLFSEDIGFRELCPGVDDQFAFFKRSKIRDLGRISGDSLVERLKNEYSALCIFNTKKTAQNMYQELRGEGVYHLSTAMYPVHRKRVLAEIRKRLDDKKRCIVLSTSLVEAGVDLDFQTVYRQLAGVDSVIQAAGRCNREGKRSLDESNTYIFQLQEREFMPGQRQQMQVTEGLLIDEKALDDLETIQKYFEELFYLRRESLDKKKILEMFQFQFEFAHAAKEFKLIENNTVTILIPIEERGREIAEQLRLGMGNKELMREAGQYCVNVYAKKAEDLCGAGIISPVSAELEDFYVLTSEEQYGEDTGLNLNIEAGQAVLW